MGTIDFPNKSIVKVMILLVGIICLVGPHSGVAKELNSNRLKKTVNDYNRGVNRLNEMKPDIQVSLTYPAGMSPKVFTRGWVFEARGIANPGSREQSDISGDVRWKGTGTFKPDRGPLSRPVFNSPGTNHITLYVEKNGKVVFEKIFGSSRKFVHEIRFGEFAQAVI